MGKLTEVEGGCRGGKRVPLLSQVTTRSRGSDLRRVAAPLRLAELKAPCSNAPGTGAASNPTCTPHHAHTCAKRCKINTCIFDTYIDNI